MVVTSKPGRVIVRREDGTRTTALDISTRVCDEMERGLVGVAVDPDFVTNRFVYLYYTHRVGGTCERPPAPGEQGEPVRRSATTTRSPSSTEKVLVDHIVSPQGHHIAGDLEFGADGYLYIAVGDGVCSMVNRTQCGPTNDNSQRRSLPHGKILRVTRSGRPPASNPYADARGARRCTRPAGVPAGTGPCKEIFASGLRNPFRIARKPGTSQFFVNDVGMHTWEEVDRLEGSQLRVERPGGSLPPRLHLGLRPGPWVHEPHPRLPARRLPVDHRRRVRSCRRVAGLEGLLPLLRLQLAGRSSGCSGRPTVASAGARSLPGPVARSICGSARTATGPRSTT